MIQLIVGKKGKGKTKHLIDSVNKAVGDCKGNIVYLDKNIKHMYELSNKIRLINVTDYPIDNSDEFVGFITGIMSEDHDLEQVYLDSFLKIAHLEDKDISNVLKKLEKLSDHFNIKFVLSISMDQEELPDFAKSQVLLAL
ncbi:twitching motility protein PilT [Anaerobium acetethylicum]|uniref:Twitching motility protein PilT n=1 Tax=Anaerobium acetethylicum TaxID=1619234 RepID=A0A1D3TNU6_9FIRM|nr:twitching motility protein PilT [Anaerobium acetethylicum]SCP95030.1 hypothetical protein SAMN05421730_1001252 [Anaerobium acetethylicum]